MDERPVQTAEVQQIQNPAPANRRRAWKKAARRRAAAWKKALRHAGGDDRSEHKARKKAAVREFRKSLRYVEDAAERRDMKKAYKAYKKRLKLGRRCAGWTLFTALVLVIVMVFGNTVTMLARVMLSQRYEDSGSDADAVRAAGLELSKELCDGGFVLLRNDEGVLPLNGKRVCVFGDDAYNFVYGGSGSAGADQSGAETLFGAFERAGIEYCPVLDEYYTGVFCQAAGADSGIKEAVLSYFGMGTGKTDWTELSEGAFTAAKEYSDTALIVLSAMEVEGNEVELGLLQPMSGLMPVRRALIDRVCREFENVIFILNSGNVMEMGFSDDYGANFSMLWVGCPGACGCYEAARVLQGEVNPSGHTVDTWPRHIEDAPGYIGYGDFTYDNIEGLHVMSYDEGIYVGYRYYETRWGTDEAEYVRNVVFPFGSGLSYTEFTQEISSFGTDGTRVFANVRVTNTGTVAGRDAVELYFCPPYYEGGLEKSAIELGAFAKTGLIQPGESETVALSFSVRDMSSYSTAKGCFVLEKGEYRFAAGNDVHDALLNEDFRTLEIGNDIIYTSDEKTGAEIDNLFAFAQGDITYLSRADWEGTFPCGRMTWHADDKTVSAYRAYETHALSGGAMPVTGAGNGIRLPALKGLSYDDPRWDAFLDQFTVKEMITLCANGGWHAEGIQHLGIPAVRFLDGPSGINSMLSPLNAAAYPMETVISSSWDVEMARKLGLAIGDEANVYGVDGWYAPAMNIHRIGIGGRNSEYYSEDPLLSGKMAAASIEAIQSRGVAAFMKHFVCNDLELNARSDISVLVSEQALREIYLRPFEISVKEAGPGGVMSSFTRLGVKWCGGSDELLNDLLRDEWGFRGAVSTDACLGRWMNAVAAVENGNDLMLEMGLQSSERKLNAAYRDNPAGTVCALRRATHSICYMIVNYINIS